MHPESTGHQPTGHQPAGNKPAGNKPLARGLFPFAAAIATAFASLAFVPTAQAHGPGHVHGVADVRASVDGETLRIGLVTPLENLVGFERAPRSDAEREAIRRMAATLRDGAKLYVPNPEAKCALVDTTLSSPVLDPALLGDAAPGKPAPSGDKAAEHADLEAVTRFRCATPGALKSVDFALLKVFPKLRRIDVQMAGPTRQSMMRLTGDRRTVSVK